MNSSEKISVIVPVYNAGAFIGTCIASVLRQTYVNYELILMDDGSTDNSSELLNAFAMADTRIRVIRQENQGVSAARNRGLDEASGAYVAFIDADDEIEKDYLERLYGDMTAHMADIVCCDFVELRDGRPVHLNVPKVLQSRLITDCVELFRNCVENREAYGTCVWGKLIRTELARRCRFQPMKIGEDQVYMFDLFLQEPSVYLDDYQGYHYIVNAAGAMQQNHVLSLSRCLDELKMHEYKLRHLPAKADALRSAYLERYAMGIHTCAHAAARLTDASERKKCRKLLLEKTREVFSQPCGLSGRAALYLRLYRYAPQLYRLLLRLRDGANQAE